ncbi:MAG: TonB-dependent siderophore receptor [Acetobacteraceae bacterium]
MNRTAAGQARPGRRLRGALPASLLLIIAGHGEAAAQATVELPPVTVQGQTETASGPVQGYVAHRSGAGTKTETPLIETPQAISVITRDQMDTQDALTINQALRYAPGVKTDPAGADIRFDGNVYIRGFLADQYLDGLKLFRGAFTAPAVEPWLLERIDIVHGPGSVLYGQASPGGFLDLISKLPTETPVHALQFQTGSYGLVQGAFDLGGKVTEDGSVLYRLSGIGRTTNTQVDHTQQQRLALAPSLTWKPDNDTKLTVLLSFLHDPNAGFYNQLPLLGTVQANPNGRIPTSFYQGSPSFDRFRRDQVTVGYMLEHRVTDAIQVFSSLRYLYQDVDYRGTYIVGVQPSLATYSRNAFADREFMNAVVMDNHAQADFDTGPLRHTVLAGVAYQYASYSQGYRENATTPINYLNPVYLPVSLPANPSIRSAALQTQSQVGIYLQDQMRVDGWSLTLGGRQDWAHNNTNNRITNANTSLDANAFSWRAALIYNFDIGIAPYFSYTTSFQPTAGLAFGAVPFKPTEGKQYEIGVKYQPQGFNALFTAALFNLTQSNVLTADPAHVNFSVQTGEVRARGLELEARMNLMAGLNLIAAYTYLDTVTTKSNSGLAGKHLNAMPDHNGSLWADYAFQSETLAGLGLGAGLRLVGPSFGNTTNTFKVQGYALVDAMIRYELGAKLPSLQGMQLQVNVSNLGDVRYIASSQNNGAYYGLRRTVYASIGYRW